MNSLLENVNLNPLKILIFLLICPQNVIFGTDKNNMGQNVPYLTLDKPHLN